MVLAQGLTTQSATAKHTLGQEYLDPNTGARYIYCQDSGSGNAQYKPCTIAPGAYTTDLLTKTNADNGYDIGVPQIAVTASYYYWCMVDSGSVTAYVHVASACASETALFTTATSGRIDDDSSSQTLIGGIELTATAATAAASANAAAKIRSPKAMAAEVRLDTTESVALATSSAASLVLAGSIANNATSVNTISSAASVAQASTDVNTSSANQNSSAASVAQASTDVNTSSAAQNSSAASVAQNSVNSNTSSCSQNSSAASAAQADIDNDQAGLAVMASVITAGSTAGSAVSIAIQSGFTALGTLWSLMVSRASAAANSNPM